MTQSALEQRLQAIEDRLAIYNLIAGHPPSADTGADYYARAAYARDGVFDRGPHPGGNGRDEIAAGLRAPAHQAAIAGGLAHFAGLPYVWIDGDTATVTSYLQILTPDVDGAPVELPNHGVSKGFRIHRVAANRWDLIRTAEGWKIQRRTLRPLDGTDGGRDILRRALEAFQP